MKGVASSTAALDAIDSGEVDPAKTVLLSDRDASGLPGLPAVGEEPSGLGEVRVISYQPNEIRLDVSALRNTVLVGTEVYWPDWRVSVDGQEGKILRADAIFRAVTVPAGQHEVRMWIAPVFLYWGGALAAAGLLVSMWLLIRREGQ